MGYAVRMPKMGMTMEEGTVVAWHADVGEAVAEGDVVAEVESEKTINEVAAREAGTLRRRFAEAGDAVEPGDPIGYVGAPDEAVPPAVLDEAGGEASEGDGATAPGATADGADAVDGPGGVVPVGAFSTVVSPRVRAYATEHGIDAAEIEEVSGTGPGGAVVERDVIEARVPGASAEAGATDAEDAAVGDGADVAFAAERPIAGMRRTIADRMTRSVAEAPQVTLTRRADVGATLSVKERLAADRGVDVSVVDFLIAAVARAAEDHPGLNGLCEDGTHRIARDVNVSVAVDVDEGLLAPVVRRVGERSVAEIGEARAAVTAAAREGTYDAADLRGGTITVTNLGPFGIETFDPILNPPQVAALGVGRLDPDGDEPTLPLCLTFDHRAVDGADAARFLAAVADALDRPLALVDGGTADGADPVGPTRRVAAGSDAADGDAAPDDGAIRAHSAGGMNAEIRARDFAWRADEPEDRDGTDTAPTPVEQFLGSLSACLALTIRAVADRRAVPLGDVTVDVTPAPGDLNVESLAVAVEATSSADRADVERVVGIAERVCPVSGVVDDDVERTVEVTVVAPE